MLGFTARAYTDATLQPHIHIASLTAFMLLGLAIATVAYGLSAFTWRSTRFYELHPSRSGGADKELDGGRARASLRACVSVGRPRGPHRAMLPVRFLRFDDPTGALAMTALVTLSFLALIACNLADLVETLQRDDGGNSSVPCAAPGPVGDMFSHGLSALGLFGLGEQGPAGEAVARRLLAGR
jgi:hypothetical protein